MNSFIINSCRSHRLWVIALAMALPTRAHAQKMSESIVEGFSQPFTVSKVASSAMGIVREQSVKAGTLVTEGSLLVKLDSDVQEKLAEFYRASAEAKADIAASETELKVARVKLEQSRSCAAVAIRPLRNCCVMNSNSKSPRHDTMQPWRNPSCVNSSTRKLLRKSSSWRFAHRLQGPLSSTSNRKGSLLDRAIPTSASSSI